MMLRIVGKDAGNGLCDMAAVTDGQYMQDPVLVDLLSYWERLRAGRVAPSRSEIDPREITSALEHTFILEYRSIGDIRFRLAGMQLNDLLGMDLRGMPARSLIALEDRNDFEDILVDLLAEPKIVELRLENVTDDGRSTARMLLLPMQNDRGEIARILGCMTVSGAALAPPQRFRVAGKADTRIVTGPEAARPVPLDATPVAGFAEAAVPFRPKGAGKPAMTRRLSTEKPYLRLVREDDDARGTDADE